MSAIDLSELGNEQPAEAPAQEQGSMLPPGVITLRNGAKFIVTEIDNIQWHGKGIFATGNYDNDSDGEKNRDVLFFDANVAAIEFDFGAVIDGEGDSD